MCSACGIDGVIDPNICGGLWNDWELELSWCEWCLRWWLYECCSNDFVDALVFGRRRRVSSFDDMISTGGANFGIGGSLPGKPFTDWERLWVVEARGVPFGDTRRGWEVEFEVGAEWTPLGVCEFEGDKAASPWSGESKLAPRGCLDISILAAAYDKRVRIWTDSYAPVNNTPNKAHEYIYLCNPIFVRRQSHAFRPVTPNSIYVGSLGCHDTWRYGLDVTGCRPLMSRSKLYGVSGSKARLYWWPRRQ